MSRWITILTSGVLAGCLEYGFEADLREGDPPPLRCETDAEAVQVSITFPGRSGCPWSTAGNLERRNEHNQARVEEVREVELPRGSELCDLTVASEPGQQVWFDDHILLALDDVVLVAGGSGLRFDELPVQDGAPRYDWAALRGQPFVDRYAPYTCLGDADCQVPRTEETGPLDVSVPASEIAGRVAGDTFELRLVTFGDDDEDDCAHAEVTLDVTAGVLR